MGSVLLVLGLVGVPAGLAMDGTEGEAASRPNPEQSVPGWQRPPEKVGKNSVTLPVEEDVWGSTGEIAGHVTVTVTEVKCGVQEIVNPEGLGWRWPSQLGQFCLVHLTAKCSPPRGDNSAACPFPLGLQTAVTASGVKVRVFDEDEGRPLNFLNEDVEGFGDGTLHLDVPGTKYSPRQASAVIPYDVPTDDAVNGLVLYTGYFSRPVEVTVGQ